MPLDQGRSHYSLNKKSILFMALFLLVLHITQEVGWWGRGITITITSLKRKCRWSSEAIHNYSLPLKIDAGWVLLSSATLGDGIKCVGEDLCEMSFSLASLTWGKHSWKAPCSFPCGCSTNKSFPYLHPWKGHVWEVQVHACGIRYKNIFMCFQDHRFSA